MIPDYIALAKRSPPRSLWIPCAPQGGKEAAFSDLSRTGQALDLWTGRVQSSFTFDGERVEVETSVHPELDLVIVKLGSPLLGSGRPGVDLRFPGVAARLNPDPADFDHPEAHRTTELARGPRGLTLQRQLDDTRYWVELGADRPVQILDAGPHTFRVASAESDELTLLVLFSRERARQPLPAASAARGAVAEHWRRFWTQGDVLEFSGSRGGLPAAQSPQWAANASERLIEQLLCPAARAAD